MQDAIAEWKVLPGGLLVFYGAGGVFRGAEYERWYRDCERSVTRYVGATGTGFLIDSEVRVHGRKLFLERRIPFATITDDLIVRGFVTTGKWFGLSIAAFSWADAPSAMTWLELPHSLAERALETLHQQRFSVNARLRQRDELGKGSKLGPRP